MNMRSILLLSSLMFHPLASAMGPSNSLLAGSEERLASAATALVSSAATVFGTVKAYKKMRNTAVTKAEDVLEQLVADSPLITPNLISDCKNAQRILMRYQVKLAVLGIFSGATLQLSQLLAFKAFDGHQFSQPTAYISPFIYATIAGMFFTAIDPLDKDPYTDQQRIVSGIIGGLLWLACVTQTIDRVNAGK